MKMNLIYVKIMEKKIEKLKMEMKSRLDLIKHIHIIFSIQNQEVVSKKTIMNEINSKSILTM